MSGPKAPKAYVPTNQPQADAGMFGALNQAGQQTSSTAAMANPGYDAAYSGVVNNPFSGSMISGITAAAGNANTIAQGDLAQGAMAGGAAAQGYGDASAVRGMVPSVLQDASSIRAQADPMAGDASAIRTGAGSVDALAALSKAYADPLTADAQNLRSFAPYLAEYGFDPNMSTYNFGLQGAKDTQNVANAESGVAGSPFAAGATGDAMEAYKRNYEASRASKAMAALAALSQLYSGAGNLDAGALAALGQSGQLTGQAGSMRGQASGINMDIANLAKLATGVDTQAAGLYGQAGDIAGNAANLGVMGSDLAHRGVETQTIAAQLPYGAVNQVYADRLQALNDAVTGRLNIASSEQGTAAGYNSYLKTGQTATELNQNAARINAQNSFLGGLGSLVGTLGSAAITHYSDIRLKNIIRRAGALPSGLPLYKFTYKDLKHGEGEQLGVIAQEAQHFFPEAVSEDADGFLLVDYGRIS